MIHGNERVAAAHTGTQSFRTEVHNRRNDYFQQRDPKRRLKIVDELRQWVWNRAGQFLTMFKRSWIEMDESNVITMIRRRFLTEHEVIYRHQ